MSCLEKTDPVFRRDQSALTDDIYKEIIRRCCRYGWDSMLTSFGVSSDMPQCEGQCFFLRDELGWMVSKPDQFKSWLAAGAARRYGETSSQVEVAKEFGDTVYSFYEQYDRLQNLQGREHYTEHGTLAQMRDLGVQVDHGIDTLVVLVAKIICESQINTDAVKMKEAFLMVFLRDEGLRYVSTTKSLVEHWEGVYSRCRL